MNLGSDPQAETLEGLLFSEACSFYGIDPTQLISTKRGYYSKARRAIALVLVTQGKWSERSVAKLFHVHHSAIQESLAHAKDLIRTDPLFLEIVERLGKLI